MENRQGAYADLTSTERRGIAGLTILLLLLLALRFFIGYITGAPATSPAQEKLTVAWESQKKAGRVAVQKPADTIININTADSLSLLSLYGIGPKLSHRILEKRQQSGPFKSYEELWALYHFSKEVKEELKKNTSL